MRFIFCLFLALWGPVAAFAQGVPSDVVRAEVLGGWQTERGTRMAALRLTLAPGWKTYWRAPGDAGIAPRFDWSGSRNLAGVSLHWPAPDVFDAFGMRTIGYADELVLPIEFRPRRAGAPIAVAAEMELGVCEDVCIPAELSFTADLSGAGAPDPLIRTALAAGPVSARRAGVAAVACRFSPISDGMQLDAKIEMPALGGGEVAVVEAGNPSVWVSEPQVARSGGTLHLRADLVPAPGTALALDRSALRFTILGTGRAVDIRGCS
ncbi:MAG: protein-disulfide reductase DsbD domain-containing protein [Pseudomonadota bacterium]